MENLREQANEIAQAAMDTYKTVTYDGDYARIGDQVWKKGSLGAWDKLSQDEVDKYDLLESAGDGNYVTDGQSHYVKSDSGWRKLTDDQVKKQESVTAVLGITPEEYWSDKREEYLFAFDQPDKYLVAKTVGGYDTYMQYKETINGISSDKDENGKSISGSKKKKVKAYIFDMDLNDGEKMVLFKSVYPADDTYNQKIIQYLQGRKDLTKSEREQILKYLEIESGR
jgi:hypothetical protein